MATEGLPVRVACRVLGVSESGYSAWLTDRIRAAHAASRGTYGARRVRAELLLGQGIAVGHQAVERLMRFLAVEGVTGQEQAIGREVARVLAEGGVPRKWIRFDDANTRIPLPTQTSKSSFS